MNTHSKIIVVIVVIILALFAVAIFIGTRTPENFPETAGQQPPAVDTSVTVTTTSTTTATTTITATSSEDEAVACTMEAKQCPDGKTFVGRQGPKCEFAACPGN